VFYGRRRAAHIRLTQSIFSFDSARHLRYNPKMSVTRIVGVVLLVVGIVLIIVGVVASRSLADSLSSVFRGRLTQQTMWYIFGGIASAVVGLLLALGVIGRSRS